MTIFSHPPCSMLTSKLEQIQVTYVLKNQKQLLEPVQLQNLLKVVLFSKNFIVFLEAVNGMHQIFLFCLPSWWVSTSKELCHGGPITLILFFFFFESNIQFKPYPDALLLIWKCPFLCYLQVRLKRSIGNPTIVIRMGGEKIEVWKVCK